jgi:hypothetical protein
VLLNPENKEAEWRDPIVWILLQGSQPKSAGVDDHLICLRISTLSGPHGAQRAE